MPTPSSVYTILCQVYPECTDVWNVHLMPFLLPDRSTQNVWMLVVFQEMKLRMFRGLPNRTYSETWDSFNDEQFIRIWRSSQAPRQDSCLDMFDHDRMKSVYSTVYRINHQSKQVRIQYSVNLGVADLILEPRCSRCQTDYCSFWMMYVGRTYMASRYVNGVCGGTKRREFNLCLECVQTLEESLEEDVIVDARTQQLWLIGSKRLSEDELGGRVDAQYVHGSFFILKNDPEWNSDKVSKLKETLQGWPENGTQG